MTDQTEIMTNSHSKIAQNIAKSTKIVTFVVVLLASQLSTANMMCAKLFKIPSKTPVWSLNSLILTNEFKNNIKNLEIDSNLSNKILATVGSELILKEKIQKHFDNGGLLIPGTKTNWFVVNIGNKKNIKISILTHGPFNHLVGYRVLSRDQKHDKEVEQSYYKVSAKFLGLQLVRASVKTENLPDKQETFSFLIRNLQNVYRITHYSNFSKELIKEAYKALERLPTLDIIKSKHPSSTNHYFISNLIDAQGNNHYIRVLFSVTAGKIRSPHDIYKVNESTESEYLNFLNAP